MDRMIHAHRIAPFEKLRDLARLDNVIFEPQTRRLLVAAGQRTAVYDRDLNRLREIEGAAGLDAVHLLLAFQPGPEVPLQK